MSRNNPKRQNQSEPLRSGTPDYGIWGASLIHPDARLQMDYAMRLPISVAGALMPGAHVGYGLPVGGVLATDNAVIPYAVGVDIACRMRLTIFPESPIVLGQQPGRFKKALMEQTRFGAGSKWDAYEQVEHAVLEDDAWTQQTLLRSLKDTAFKQLGTSGSGNHFVEWGALELDSDDADTGLRAGRYLALLSHSGSRGVGFRITNHFSELARSQHPDLDPAVRHMAWFTLTSGDGQDYWQAMELAGRFAAANHEVIHQRLTRAAGLKPLLTVENHHNFAWKMMIPVQVRFAAPAREVIVHRKGATPAGDGVLGIVPGSMGAPGYLVRGRGNAKALNSAAHGAGRAMSRREAMGSITRRDRDQMLLEQGITLLGGGVDEAPQAYKSIEQVMQAQKDLVSVVARFHPKIVRMADERGPT
ncbi:MAG TPA: RtcB family protein [Candidatus Limnocylindrales bacterium]|nr:RtcB family protein [Candidatus Limnocylindrales bacterium]